MAASGCLGINYDNVRSMSIRSIIILFCFFDVHHWPHPERRMHDDTNTPAVIPRGAESTGALRRHAIPPSFRAPLLRDGIHRLKRSPAVIPHRYCGEE
jgi:hypothetical protein